MFFQLDVLMIDDTKQALHALTLFAFLLVPAAAAAQPSTVQPESASATEVVSETSTYKSRQTSLVAAFGVGAPTGFLGFEIERVFLKNFSIGAGVGAAAHGHPQIAVDGRIRHVWRTSAFGISLGVSRGDDEYLQICLPVDCPNKILTDVVWGNAGLHWEERSPRGWLLRITAGMSKRLTFEGCVQGDSPCTELDDTLVMFPYLRVDVGLTFLAPLRGAS